MDALSIYSKSIKGRSWADICSDEDLSQSISMAIERQKIATAAKIAQANRTNGAVSNESLPTLPESHEPSKASNDSGSTTSGPSAAANNFPQAVQRTSNDPSIVSGRKFAGGFTGLSGLIAKPSAHNDNGSEESGSEETDNTDSLEGGSPMASPMGQVKTGADSIEADSGPCSENSPYASNHAMVAVKARQDVRCGSEKNSISRKEEYNPLEWRTARPKNFKSVVEHCRTAPGFNENQHASGDPVLNSLAQTNSTRFQQPRYAKPRNGPAVAPHQPRRPVVKSREAEKGPVSEKDPHPRYPPQQTWRKAPCDNRGEPLQTHTGRTPIYPGKPDLTRSGRVQDSNSACKPPGPDVSPQDIRKNLSSGGTTRRLPDSRADSLRCSPPIVTAGEPPTHHYDKQSIADIHESHGYGCPRRANEPFKYNRPHPVAHNRYEEATFVKPGPTQLGMANQTVETYITKEEENDNSVHHHYHYHYHYHIDGHVPFPPVSKPAEPAQQFIPPTSSRRIPIHQPPLPNFPVDPVVSAHFSRPVSVDMPRDLSTLQTPSSVLGDAHRLQFLGPHRLDDQKSDIRTGEPSVVAKSDNQSLFTPQRNTSNALESGQNHMPSVPRADEAVGLKVPNKPVTESVVTPDPVADARDKRQASKGITLGDFMEYSIKAKGGHKAPVEEPGEDAVTDIGTGHDTRHHQSNNRQMDRRMAYRQKQIAVGKTSTEYRNYIRIKHTSSRMKADDPSTPDLSAHPSCSKFNVSVANWRRQLHKYDSEKVSTELAESNGSLPGSITLSVEEQRSDKQKYDMSGLTRQEHNQLLKFAAEVMQPKLPSTKRISGKPRQGCGEIQRSIQSTAAATSDGMDSTAAPFDACGVPRHC